MTTKDVRVFHAVSMGESHKIKNIPCQDAVAGFEDPEKGIYVGVVSDGHGSRQYFRSDRGSRLLVNIAQETILEFIQNQDKEVLSVPFRAIPAFFTDSKLNPDRKFTQQDIAFRRLFSAIIAKWNDAIYDDWNNDTPGEEQMKALQVPDDYLSSFLQGNNIEMAYGCTLIAFARTSDYWFAFQIGDGKCIAFDTEANSQEPVPWDERCIGSTTTSICESSALDSFRYCCSNERFPVALFIGSDGMDGAYGTMDEFSVPLLTGLYENIIKSFARNGYDATVAEIVEMLPKLSEQGVTRDDVSIAGWIDLGGAKSILPVFVEREISSIEKKLQETEKLIKEKNEILLRLESEMRVKQSLYEKKLKEAKRAESELDTAIGEYLKSERRKSDAEKRYEIFRAETEGVNAEISGMNEVLVSAKTFMETTEEKANELKNRLKNLENEIGVLQKAEEPANIPSTTVSPVQNETNQPTE